MTDWATEHAFHNVHSTFFISDAPGTSRAAGCPKPGGPGAAPGRLAIQNSERLVRTVALTSPARRRLRVLDPLSAGGLRVQAGPPTIPDGVQRARWLDTVLPWSPAALRIRRGPAQRVV